MTETTKVKIGDTPVDSRYKFGGYSAGLTYEMSKQEAKEIVNAKLGSYAQKTPANKGKSPKRGTVNSSRKTPPAGTRRSSGNSSGASAGNDEKGDK